MSHSRGSRGQRSAGNRSVGNRSVGNRSGGNRSVGNRSAGNQSAGNRSRGIQEFLENLSPGTRIRIQFDGGGIQGAFRGTFEGMDGFGNALFTDLRSLTTGIRLRRLTRINIKDINAIST
ncbi:hypothetical protein [Paenibacillus sp. FSL W8-0194]|uniref:hypothetical protein n=1 Tax=Paenibacillus sp. FSL W8-0194 TaxID=2921711 RepID=UPI0030DAAB16